MTTAILHKLSYKSCIVSVTSRQCEFYSVTIKGSFNSCFVRLCVAARLNPSRVRISLFLTTVNILQIVIIIKGKVVPLLLIKHYAMKASMGVDV
jgi:hypothetical protein